MGGNSGTPEQPILITDYGSSNNRAVIDASTERYALNLSNVEYIRVEHIELIAKGVYGANFYPFSAARIWEHFHLDNLYIHDTIDDRIFDEDGQVVAGTDGTGIKFLVTNQGGYTLKDISVTNSILEDLKGPGITINKWAGDVIQSIDEIDPADRLRTAGIYTDITTTNIDRYISDPARFTVTVDVNGSAQVTLTYPGTGYNKNDDLVISDSSLGGGSAADLTMRVSSVMPATPNSFYNEDVLIEDNVIRRVDGAGMQIGKVRNGIIRGNIVIDPGRDYQLAGSGLWTWNCGTPTSTFLVEHNLFTGAQGITDAAGAHIDIGCVNNIFQYNLSIENEGGFAEILGKATNNVYRYNISINDGARVLGENGSFQWGKTLFLGGYTGINGPKLGPYNSYIYNNTIYLKGDRVSRYDIEPTAAGALIANNLIVIDGIAQNMDDNNSKTQIIFDNNFGSIAKVPSPAFNTVQNNTDVDPQYANPGGLEPQDYIPQNIDALIDASIDIYKLTGDTDGILGGFTVNEDFFGNPIIGRPDIGAIEFGSDTHWLRDYGYASNTDLSQTQNSMGLLLLKAYAFRLDPSIASPSDLPKLQRHENQLKLRFYGSTPGVNYNAHQSQNLINWDRANTEWLTGPDAEGYYEYSIPESF